MYGVVYKRTVRKRTQSEHATARPTHPRLQRRRHPELGRSVKRNGPTEVTNRDAPRSVRIRSVSARKARYILGTRLVEIPQSDNRLAERLTLHEKLSRHLQCTRGG